MSVKQSLLFFSLAALAFGGAASAQDRDQNFRNRDSNNDGVLTQREYGGHPGNFRSLDVNGDGVLSYDEFVRRGARTTDPPEFADDFSVMDRNNDGVLSRGEWNSEDWRFRRIDRNDDGVVTRAEYNDQSTRPMDTDATRRFRFLDRNDDGVLTRRESALSAAEFRRADVNRNGVLTADEYMNRGLAYNDSGAFGTLDRNNDGVLSSWEWRGDRDDFDRLDRNNDRVLSRAEYGNQAAALSGSRMDEFRSLDRNGNGVLTRSEARMSSSDFDRADDNDDGVLTLKEYSNTEYRQTGGGFFGSILGRVDEQRFRDLDVNNDGILRPGEWRGNIADFDRMDLNRDGVVTYSEYSR